jgi:hypothetical protein
MQFVGPGCSQAHDFILGRIVMIQTSMDRTGVRVGNVIRGFALALMFGAMAIAVPTARAPGSLRFDHWNGS